MLVKEDGDVLVMEARGWARVSGVAGVASKARQKTGVLPTFTKHGTPRLWCPSIGRWMTSKAVPAGSIRNGKMKTTEVAEALGASDVYIRFP